MELFAEDHNEERLYTPLAERCRPRTLSEFIGHQKIVGQGTVLEREIGRSHLKSMIFWGPPGVGKTTLAYIIAREVEAVFRPVSAVDSGVKEVRQVIEEAQKRRKYSGQSTILFIDEIHRFNKAQQDALLKAVEKGIIILIGATTENPSFEIIAPLLSRSHIYQLKALTDQQIRKIVERAMKVDPVLSQKNIDIGDWPTLYRLANGDARRALNLIEKSMEIVSEKEGRYLLDHSVFEKAALKKVSYYDKSGEYHYDLISAFIKSLRGSDPDAAIYWMARMLEAGEDPKFLARRMVILASEDIGNADPAAITLATSVFTAVNYVGLPECKIILTQAAAYLAAAPKSNAVIRAINKAAEDVQKYPDLAVPLRIRNAPTSLLADLGYGKDYRYVHDFPDHFVRENYLPDELKSRIYYQPTQQGDENRIAKYLKNLWLNLKAYKG